MAARKLDILKLRRAGPYFVEFSLKGTDFFYEKGFKSGWKKKTNIKNRDVYVPVTMDDVIDVCDEDTKKILMENIHLFVKVK